MIPTMSQAPAEAPKEEETVSGTTLWNFQLSFFCFKPVSFAGADRPRREQQGDRDGSAVSFIFLGS